MTHSKKRKRTQDGLTVALLDEQSPPIIASFPSVQPPADTPFSQYTSKANGDSIVAGETDVTEFATDLEQTRAVAGSSGCYYLLAIHKPSTSTLQVLPSPISPHVFASPVVKRLKHSSDNPISSTDDYYKARNALGEAFGSKKAKAAIRQRERNQVDVNAMEGVVNHLMDGIDQGSKTLLSKDQVQEAADAARPIPPHNIDATSPSGIYPLHGIIPKSEWKSIDTAPFSEAESLHGRIFLLHASNSQWLKHNLTLLEHQGNDKKWKETMKLLIYISTLLAFSRMTSKPGKYTKEKIQNMLSSTPANIIDGLLSRFMETSRDNSNQYQQTTKSTTLLQTYMFALVLRVDRWSTDVSSIAHDLSLANKSVEALFKTLGCTIRVATDREREALGLAQSSSSQRRAILKVPLTFPKPRTMKKRKK